MAGYPSGVARKAQSIDGRAGRCSIMCWRSSAGRATDCPGRAFGHFDQLGAISKAGRCECTAEIGAASDAGGVGEIGTSGASRGGIADKRNVEAESLAVSNHAPIGAALALLRVGEGVNDVHWSVLRGSGQCGERR